MFDVGGGELILIILVILLLFGPEKMPEFARTINKGLRKVKEAQAQFQSQLNDIQKDINSTIDLDDDKSSSAEFKPIPPPDIDKYESDKKLSEDENTLAGDVEESATKSSENKDEKSKSNNENND